MTILLHDDFIRPWVDKKQGVRFLQKTEHDFFPIYYGNAKGKHEHDDDDGDDYEDDDDDYEDEDGWEKQAFAFGRKPNTLFQYFMET